jgi:hypothetical protein
VFNAHRASGRGSALVGVFQGHHADFPHGVIRPIRHEPSALQNDFVDPAGRIAPPEVTLAKRLLLHLVERHARLALPGPGELRNVRAAASLKTNWWLATVRPARRRA